MTRQSPARFAAAILGIVAVLVSSAPAYAGPPVTPVDNVGLQIQGSQSDAACATDAGNCTMQALLKRMNGRLTAAIAGTTVLGSAGTAFTQGAGAAGANSLNVFGTVVGNVASLAADSGNPVKTGAVYNTTPPAPTNGQRVDSQADSYGNHRVVPADSLIPLFVSQSAGASYAASTGTISFTAANGTVVLDTQGAGALTFFPSAGATSVKQVTWSNSATGAPSSGTGRTISAGVAAAMEGTVFASGAITVNAFGRYAVISDTSFTSNDSVQVMTKASPVPVGSLFATVTGSVTATPVGSASTSTGGTITTGGSYQNALASSATRKGCLVINKSLTNPMFVSLGASPTDATAVRLAAGTATADGGSFSCGLAQGVVITDQINVKTATTADPFLVISQ